MLDPKTPPRGLVPTADPAETINEPSSLQTYAQVLASAPLDTSMRNSDQDSPDNAAAVVLPVALFGTFKPFPRLPRELRDLIVSPSKFRSPCYTSYYLTLTACILLHTQQKLTHISGKLQYHLKDAQSRFCVHLTVASTLAAPSRTTWKPYSKLLQSREDVFWKVIRRSRYATRAYIS